MLSLTVYMRNCWYTVVNGEGSLQDNRQEDMHDRLMISNDSYILRCCCCYYYLKRRRVII